MISDEILQEHLIVEFLFADSLNRDFFITENYGKLPGIYNIVKIVGDSFLNGEKSVTVDIPDVGEVEIVFQYFKGWTNRNVVGYCDYSGVKPRIIVNVESTGRNSAVEEVKRIVAHEIIHARHEKGVEERYSEEMSIDNFEKGYRAAVLFSKDNDPLVSSFGYTLYYLSKSEQNAFIGQTCVEIENMGNEIKDHKSAMECIKKTDAYARIFTLGKRIELLKSANKEDMQNLVDGYAHLTGIKTTPSKLLGYINNEYRKFVDKFYRQVSKMAYEQYEKHNTERFEPKMKDDLYEDLRKTRDFMERLGNVK